MNDVYVDGKHVELSIWDTAGKKNKKRERKDGLT